MTKLPLVALEDALRTLPDTLGRSRGELRVSRLLKFACKNS